MTMHILDKLLYSDYCLFPNLKSTCMNRNCQPMMNRSATE